MEGIDHFVIRCEYVVEKSVRMKILMSNRVELPKDGMNWVPMTRCTILI